MTHKKDRRAPCGRVEQSVFASVYEAIFPREINAGANVDDAHEVAYEAAEAAARDVSAERGKCQTNADQEVLKKRKPTKGLPWLQFVIGIIKFIGPIVAFAIALDSSPLFNTNWIFYSIVILVAIGWSMDYTYHAKQGQDRHEEILNTIQQRCC